MAHQHGIVFLGIQRAIGFHHQRIAGQGLSALQQKRCGEFNKLGLYEAHGLVGRHNTVFLRLDCWFSQAFEYKSQTGFEGGPVAGSVFVQLTHQGVNFIDVKCSSHFFDQFLRGLKVGFQQQLFHIQQLRRMH